MKAPVERNGPCLAVRFVGSCPCRGYRYGTTVGRYDQCQCEHSRGVHALGEALPNFTGLTPNECGPHDTIGARAWCSTDTEYCSAEAPCRGCEIPLLRARIVDLEDQLNRRGEA